jgi:hypothetical protein
MDYVQFYKKEIGATGFEPATSWSQTTRSTKLSYAPVKPENRWFSGKHKSSSAFFEGLGYSNNSWAKTLRQ